MHGNGQQQVGGGRKARPVKLAPMAHAVRNALAVSAMAVAFGFGSGAVAAPRQAPADTLLIAAQSRAAAQLPLADPSIVAPSLMAALTANPGSGTCNVAPGTYISCYGPDDISIDNADPYTYVSATNSTFGIGAYSYGGDVAITNRAGGTLTAVSAAGNAFGIYAYATVGNTQVDNAAGILAYSATGLADAIFATGADVGVANSGDLYAISGGAWAAGIEASGSGQVTVDNSGAILAYAPGGQATGIFAYGGAGVEVHNTGAIEAQGYLATGIEARSSGDVMVENAGAIVAGSLTYSYNPYTYTGYLYGSALANGINASSNGTGAAVQVANSGDVSVESYFGGAAIAATASGSGGTATVVNSGNVQASQYYKYGYGAYGIVTSADGDSTIANSGDITVTSGGVANGLTALSFAGTASVDNSGHVSVDSTASSYFAATGITAFSANGSAQVANSGSVDATAKYWATGINATAQGDVAVDNSGSVYANGEKYAFGVYAVSNAGNVSVHNAAGGDIGFYSYLGRGWGVFGFASLGDVELVNDGAIAGYAFGQSAGMFANAVQGDATVVNTGSIAVSSGGNVAVGAFARADYGTASISNSGDIVASDFPGGYYTGYSAYGMFARGAYAQVSNSGTIVADGYYYATGMMAMSVYGTVVNNTGGSITATATGGATGINAYSALGDVAVSNASDVTAIGLVFGATGINADGAGDVGVTNSGDIYAASLLGPAIGIQAASPSGSITVGNAAGTSVYAVSYYGAAVGVRTVTYDGDATVNNAGTIHAAAMPGTFAAGVMFSNSSGTGTNTLNNAAGGQIYATGSDGYAWAVYGSDAVEVINNKGIIRGAIALGGGNDVFNNQAGGLWDVAGSLYASFGDGNDTLNNAAGATVKLSGGTIDFGNGNDALNNAGQVLVSSTITFGAGNDTLANASGGVLTIGPGSLVDMDAGDDTVTNAGQIGIAATGTLALGDGNDSLSNAGSGLIDLFGQITGGNGDDTLSNAGLFRMNNGWVLLGAGTNAFANTGTLRVIGNGNQIDLGTGTLTNGGVVDFLNGATTDRLTITGTLAGTGSMRIDANLGTLAADQLVVNGNVAANAVQTVNVQFTGVPTAAVTTIPFATITGTSAAGNFVGGNLVGFNANTSWLLLGLTVSSAMNAPNDVFSINLNVNGLSDPGTLAASIASGAAGIVNTAIGTFRQRLGTQPFGAPGKVISPYVRVFMGEGDVRPAHVAANFGQGGNFNYNQSTWGREVGVNANLFGNFHAGLALGSANSRQRLIDGGMGVNRFDGMTWGAYATWYQPQGWYVDLSGRWMAANVHSQSSAGDLPTRTHTRGYSLEVGYEWDLGGLTLIPQAQYTWTEVQDVRTLYGPQGAFQADGGTFARGRLGLELSKSFTSGNGLLWTPYGAIHAVREFDGKTTYTAATYFNGSTSLKGTSAMAELGLGVGKDSWAFTLGANWTDGGAFKRTLGGQAVLRLAW